MMEVVFFGPFVPDGLRNPKSPEHVIVPVLQHEHVLCLARPWGRY